MHSRIMGSRSLGAVGVVLALMLMLALTASSALATTGHTFADQFGTPGDNGPGGFQGGPVGVTVRQSTGDVYLSDPGHTPDPRIERFNAAGAYLDEISIDPSLYNNPGFLASDSAGNVYVAANEVATGSGIVLKYSTAGAFLLAFRAGPNTSINNPSIAVDPVDGTVYVAATDTILGTPVVATYNASGAFTGTITGGNGSPDGGFFSLYGLAVDGSHRLYVADGTKGRVDRYSAGGAWQATVDDGSRGAAVSVAADPTSNEIYALENGSSGQQQVAWFSAAGASRLETFGAGHITTAYSIAVNHATGTVYTPDAGAGVVERFTTFAGPTVTTTAATAVGSTDATLNGTIDPEGIATTYHFEYGLDTNYGTSTADDSAGSGNSPVPATATPTGLLPNTLYHARLVGTNADGSIYGDDVTFTTATAPPVLDGSPPFISAVTADGGTLNGTVNPRGSDTTYRFEYGTTTAYGSTTSDAVITADQADHAVSIVATGLAAGTLYHFRLSAENGTGGTQTGTDQTFYTAPGTPGDATDITGQTATLTGVTNRQGTGDLIYQFEWGLTAGSYGHLTDLALAPAGSGDQAVTAPITGLTAGTTYHVRVVATDITTGVTITGADGAFTTQPPPAVTTGAVTGVTTDSATFTGQFNTHNLGGNYRFYVESTTNPYVGKTEQVAIGTSTTTGTATGTLTDLVPGQTYTVRLAVFGTGVTVYGDTVTFSTAPKPTVQPPAPPTTVNNPYGCLSPVLAAYNPHPKPGQTITIGGSDLGVGGTVALGDDKLKPKGWSATGFSITLPDDATGTLPLTINCGKASNTIAIQIYKAPSNSFTATGKTKGSTATLTVKVPGPGSISVTSGSVKKATKHASKAGNNSVKVTLNAKAAKSLKRNKKLTVSLKVQFTPTGGTSASKTVKVTFKK
jgi:hypothetical protein